MRQPIFDEKNKAVLGYVDFTDVKNELDEILKKVRKKKTCLDKIWLEFIKYGSGFKFEGERDFDKKGSPYIYHLHMYGLWYPDDYELVGTNLQKLLKQAIKDGEKFMNEYMKRRKK